MWYPDEPESRSTIQDNLLAPKLLPTFSMEKQKKEGGII